MAVSLKKKVIAALKTVYDPELPVDIYELGLIYDLHINAKERSVKVVMTLTTPSCPAAESLPAAVREALLQLPEIETVDIELTFDPPYTPARLSEEARALLGWEGVTN